MRWFLVSTIRKNNEYDCTNYRILPCIFYNLSKENIKEYLKLFSNKPEPIMKYLDKIDGEKEKGDDDEPLEAEKIRQAVHLMYTATACAVIFMSCVYWWV